ncbi:hypothetical protein [Streptomyces nogalater]|uniref:Uncharacterized protein n=1 Tax=Streptomyces nogalater TaxID=38314 RepID=A0ABW0WXH4_STRNO
MVLRILATLPITFERQNRSTAFALYGAIMALANALGPEVGGLLTEADLSGLCWRPMCRGSRGFPARTICPMPATWSFIHGVEPGRKLAGVSGW